MIPFRGDWLPPRDRDRAVEGGDSSIKLAIVAGRPREGARGSWDVGGRWDTPVIGRTGEFS